MRIGHLLSWQDWRRTKKDFWKEAVVEPKHDPAEQIEGVNQKCQLYFLAVDAENVTGARRWRWLKTRGEDPRWDAECDHAEYEDAPTWTFLG